jgi:hypothetical protein
MTLLIKNVLHIQATPLFKKHHKIVWDIISTHAVKGVFYCEKLCLDMGDTCRAANVVATDGKYTCEVMETFSYNEDQVQDLMISNPRGKLIIKQGMYIFRLYFMVIFDSNRHHYSHIHKLISSKTESLDPRLFILYQFSWLDWLILKPPCLY